MAGHDANWLPLRAAAERIGAHYEVVRRLAKIGVFTRAAFSAATKKPPIFLDIRELDAWKAGGIDAVRKLQDRREKRTAKAGA